MILYYIILYLHFHFSLYFIVSIVIDYSLPSAVATIKMCENVKAEPVLPARTSRQCITRTVFGSCFLWIRKSIPRRRRAQRRTQELTETPTKAPPYPRASGTAKRTVVQIHANTKCKPVTKSDHAPESRQVMHHE